MKKFHPMPEQLQLEYPILAYFESTPKHDEVSLLHLSENVSLKTIKLEGGNFVCFVGHPQKVEQILFDQENESFCHVMLLMRLPSDRN